MLTSNIKNSEWDINESIQAYFLVLSFLGKPLNLWRRKEKMSSCVMIVSEFSNRIEAIFSYQKPVEVRTVSKKKKQLKNKNTGCFWISNS